jgi:hypothetical protein
MVGAPRFELGTPSSSGLRAGNDSSTRGRRLDHGADVVFMQQEIRMARFGATSVLFLIFFATPALSAEMPSRKPLSATSKSRQVQ